jgi:hypothetical protein
MATYVSPRAGFTHHPLTTHGAAHLIDLVDGPSIIEASTSHETRPAAGVMSKQVERQSARRAALPSRTMDSSLTSAGFAMMDAATEMWQASNRESASPARSSCPAPALRLARACPPARSTAAPASAPAAVPARAVRTRGAAAHRHRPARAPDSTIPSARSRPCSRHRIRPTTRPSTRAGDPPTHPQRGCRFREPWFLEPDSQ